MCTQVSIMFNVCYIVFRREPCKKNAINHDQRETQMNYKRAQAADKTRFMIGRFIASSLEITPNVRLVKSMVRSRMY